MADQEVHFNDGIAPYPLPRVTIKFCTQCKWNLRAAYFAQELLSTFSTALGEVSLQPSTGGTFTVEIFHQQPTPSPPSPTPSTTPAKILTRVLWDRKLDGGFPETKELKRRVRDVIEPGRDLGHVDRDHNAAKPAATTTTTTAVEEEKKKLPSRAELEAAGQAGSGYPGAGEAAAQLLGDVKGGEGEKKCEDCA